MVCNLQQQACSLQEKNCVAAGCDLHGANVCWRLRCLHGEWRMPQARIAGGCITDALLAADQNGFPPLGYNRLVIGVLA